MAEIDPEKNLMVNYIPSSLSEDDFSEIFSQIGKIASCKLMVHKDTGESKGFGFISFVNPLHSSMAIDQLNGLELQGKKLKVSYANKQSGEKETGANSNVYIAGLPASMDEDQLKELFSPFGEIQTQKIIDKGGAGRGIAFIRYATKSEAESAISAMAGKELPGAAIALTVKFAIPAADKKPQTEIAGHDMAGTPLTNNRYNPMAGREKTPAIPAIPPEVLRVVASTGMSVMPSTGHAAIVSGQVASLYVYGLPAESTATTLYELFSPFGGILNVRPIFDLQKEDKPCKGFAFVNFRKYEEACLAMVAMNGFVYEGKPLQVSFKQNKGGSGGDMYDSFNSPFTAHQQVQQRHIGAHQFKPY